MYGIHIKEDVFMERNEWEDNLNRKLLCIK